MIKQKFTFRILTLNTLFALLITLGGCNRADVPQPTADDSATASASSANPASAGKKDPGRECTLQPTRLSEFQELLGNKLKPIPPGHTPAMQGIWNYDDVYYYKIKSQVHELYVFNDLNELETARQNNCSKNYSVKVTGCDLATGKDIVEVTCAGTGSTCDYDALGKMYQCVSPT